MNLQSLNKVEKPQVYLDKAILQTNKMISGLRSSSKVKGRIFERSKIIESKKVFNLAKILMSDLERIEKSFPTIDNLPLFYQELIDTVIGTVKLKKSLAGLSWLKNKISELSKKEVKEIKKTTEIKRMNQIRKRFLGRVGSMYKKIGKDFDVLEDARRKFRGFPSVKTNLKTICIAGYPNVGKSTLLTKLTTARPEINVYPFTTKSLMMGYIGKKIQLIDTPGTFREDIKKMNYIERQAYLALKYLAEEVIFVFDISESCGFEVDEQKKLFNLIKRKFGDKKMTIFLSKEDLIDRKVIDDFKKGYKDYTIFYDVKVLKKMLKK